MTLSAIEQAMADLHTANETVAQNMQGSPDKSRDGEQAAIAAIATLDALQDGFNDEQREQFIIERMMLYGNQRAMGKAK